MSDNAIAPVSTGKTLDEKLQDLSLGADQRTNDLMLRESNSWLNPQTWRTMTIVAQTFVQSGAMPKSMDTVPKVIVALQAGKEAGMQPLEAINSYYFVNGKVNIYGQMAIAQVLKAGHRIKWGVCDDKTATITIIRGDNQEEMSATFTMEMAKARGLTANAVYAKYPENMLKFKAFYQVANFHCPEALHGVKIKEISEAEDVVEEMPKTFVTSKMSNPEALNVTKPGAMIPVEELSLEEAINKKDEEEIDITDSEVAKGLKAELDKPDENVKPKDEPVKEKTLLENVMDNFGGEVIEEIPAAPKSGLDKLRDTANKIGKK